MLQLKYTLFTNLYVYLRVDTDQISTWGEQSLMSFNTDKCHMVTLGSYVDHYEESNYTMSKYGNSLPLN